MPIKRDWTIPQEWEGYIYPVPVRPFMSRSGVDAWLREYNTRHEPSGHNLPIDGTNQEREEMKTIYRFPGSTTIMGPLRVYPAWLPARLVNFIDCRRYIRWLFMAVLLLAVLPTAGAFGQDATHCQSLDALTVAPDIHEVCTFPDGSGEEITTVNGTYDSVTYSATDWNSHLQNLIKADAEAANAESKIMERSAKIEGSENKKECRSNGGVWQGISSEYGPGCLAPETYIELSTNKKECLKRGGMWKDNPPASNEHVCLAPLPKP